MFSLFSKEKLKSFHLIWYVQHFGDHTLSKLSIPNPHKCITHSLKKSKPVNTPLVPLGSEHGRGEPPVPRESNALQFIHKAQRHKHREKRSADRGAESARIKRVREDGEEEREKDKKDKRGGEAERVRGGMQ